jgi:DNA repair protein RAD5
MIIQINSGGTGLNLQHFNSVYFTSPQWNPEIEAQAIARVNRIGQKDTVIVRRFIVGNLKKDTIEKRILTIQKRKKELIDKWVNGVKD